MNKLFAHPADCEIEILRKVSDGELRVVHTQRKRKLQRRGVYCQWSNYFGAWLWKPANQHEE